MYLSYSGYQLAEQCRYRYWNAYIGKTPAQPEDILGSVYGSSVGLLFEEFYDQRLWTLPNVRAEMEGRVDRVVSHYLAEGQQPNAKKGTPGGLVKWKGDGEGQNPRGLYATREELVSDVRIAVSRGLSTIRVHRLLGQGAKAELKLDAHVQGHILGGRADIVLTRVQPYGDLVILDGKGSRQRDKYVSPIQLLWYSMLYAEHHGRLPDKTAFVYWHFDPPSNVDWCNVSAEQTSALKTKALRTVNKLSQLADHIGSSKDLALVRESFVPKANASNCRFCPYATQSVCAQGFEVVTELERKKIEGQNGFVRPNSRTSRRSLAPSPRSSLEKIQASGYPGGEASRAAASED